MSHNSKSIIQSLITPVVIAIVGGLGTYFITEQQIKSSIRLSESQIQSAESLAKSNQQVKIIEIFSDQIVSKDLREREIAIRILESLEPDLATKLISAVENTQTEDTLIRNIAKDIRTRDLSKGHSYTLISSHSHLDSAVKYAEKMKDRAKYPLHIYKGINGYYAVCLGGKLTIKEALKRKQYAIENNIASDSYVRTNENWGMNLYK